MKDDLLNFFRLLNQKTNAGGLHQPVEAIRKFLLSTDQRIRRTSDQNLFTHFYAGTESFPDFLQQCAGDHLQGLYLEVISPYLGDAPTSEPLEELIRRFHPKCGFYSHVIETAQPPAQPQFLRLSRAWTESHGAGCPEPLCLVALQKTLLPALFMRRSIDSSAKSLSANFALSVQ
jgi:hypothetical protein